MGLRRRIFFPLLGDGIFTQEGQSWKHSRQLLRPQFAWRQYWDLEIFEYHVNHLLNLLNQNSGEVDLQPLFFRLTLDTTTEFLFGKSANSLKERDSPGVAKFAEEFDCAQNYVVQRFRLTDLYWLIGGPNFQRSCASVHRFLDEIIETRDNKDHQSMGAKRRYVFLDSIAKELKEEKLKSRETLRAQLVNVLLAGRDTTACLLTWTL